MIIDKKIVTIIGLGLIGSSILKAFNYYFDNLIIGYSYKTNYLP